MNRQTHRFIFNAQGVPAETLELFDFVRFVDLFWLRESEGWVNAEDLQVGDDIRNAGGSTGEVESITTEETSQEMYNLTVDEAHTFFVGDGQWLVHNDARCLVVGENSFEYSFALHKKRSDLGIIATSYESFSDLAQKARRWNYTLPSPERGFAMLDNIDARFLGSYFPSNSFDAVIFNNPHILAGDDTGTLTAELIDDFLGSAPSVLRSSGQVHIDVTSKLLNSYDEVANSLSEYTIRQAFKNSEFYAPYLARYSTGQPYKFWYPEKSGSLINHIFIPDR